MDHDDVRLFGWNQPMVRAFTRRLIQSWIDRCILRLFELFGPALLPESRHDLYLMQTSPETRHWKVASSKWRDIRITLHLVSAPPGCGRFQSAPSGQATMGVFSVYTSSAMLALQQHIKYIEGTKTIETARPRTLWRFRMSNERLGKIGDISAQTKSSNRMAPT